MKSTNMFQCVSAVAWDAGRRKARAVSDPEIRGKRVTSRLEHLLHIGAFVPAHCTLHTAHCTPISAITQAVNAYLLLKACA